MVSSALLVTRSSHPLATVPRAARSIATPEVIEARLAELRDLGVPARYHPADLRQRTQIADLIATNRTMAAWISW
jgi:hypothetical protein